MKKILFVLAILLTTLLLIGCSAKKISDVKNDDFVGKTVKVSGEVKNTIKIGSISGYIIADETGEIAVSAKKLPQEGTSRTASGVLMKDTIFGYYIKSDE